MVDSDGRPINAYVVLYNRDGHEIAPDFGSDADYAKHYDFFTVNGESVFNSDGVISSDAPILLISASSGHVTVIPRVDGYLSVMIKPTDERKRFMHGIYEGIGWVDLDGTIHFNLQRPIA